MMKIFKADQGRRIKLCLKQSLRTTTRFAVQRLHEVQLKIEKTNKKYKAAADKKRQEKLFEEEDMMMVYLRRKRIPTERVPTKQRNPDRNSRTSSFEEGGTDVGDQEQGKTTSRPK